MQLFLYLKSLRQLKYVANTRISVVYENGYAITDINDTHKKDRICFIWKVKLNILELMSSLSATTHWLLPVEYSVA